MERKVTIITYFVVVFSFCNGNASAMPQNQQPEEKANDIIYFPEEFQAIKTCARQTYESYMQCHQPREGGYNFDVDNSGKLSNWLWSFNWLPVVENIIQYMNTDNVNNIKSLLISTLDSLISIVDSVKFRLEPSNLNKISGQQHVKRRVILTLEGVKHIVSDIDAAEVSEFKDDLLFLLEAAEYVNRQGSEGESDPLANKWGNEHTDWQEYFDRIMKHVNFAQIFKDKEIMPLEIEENYLPDDFNSLKNRYWSVDWSPETVDKDVSQDLDADKVDNVKNDNDKSVVDPVKHNLNKKLNNAIKTNVNGVSGLLDKKRAESIFDLLLDIKKIVLSIMEKLLNITRTSEKNLIQADGSDDIDPLMTCMNAAFKDFADCFIVEIRRESTDEVDRR